MKTKIIDWIVLFLMMLIVLFIFYKICTIKKPIINNNKLDSLNKELLYKDSIINYKDKQVNSLIQSDSIRMNIINKSINQIKNEIKKNSSQVFNVSDSYFQQYVDSLRTKGFNKIQH